MVMEGGNSLFTLYNDSKEPIDLDGARYYMHLEDGSKHFLLPERASTHINPKSFKDIWIKNVLAIKRNKDQVTAYSILLSNEISIKFEK